LDGGGGTRRAHTTGRHARSGRRTRGGAGKADGAGATVSRDSSYGGGSSGSIRICGHGGNGGAGWFAFA